METGFYFDEMENFKKDLLQKTAKNFPDETNKFLKSQQNGLCKEMQKVAKQVVKHTGKKSGSKFYKDYHKSFKVGKIYERDGNLCGRTYNNARHAHLIETGHKNKDGSWQEGKHVMEISKTNYKDTFYKEVEDFLFNEIDKADKK